ncbi:hypothetical protein ETU09_02625 [Apibacter muscae]|uniref:Uncharacterized protein n=1 Tax=Apibacter muscae TaxID=2509004 RepID=A0A563DI72_9FLAO|nr:hypothetical protein [Apibacter muscae]TWP29895.1 hypothetical protein ETU09_02625 [Apibacter muscae]
MKKLLSFLFCIFLMVSCQSQTDLEALKFGTDISTLLNKLEDQHKDTDYNIPRYGYSTQQLDHFMIGNIALNTYSFDNYYNTLDNELYLAVDSYKNNQYVGFSALIQDTEKEQELTDYFLSQMGVPIKKYINEKKEKGYLDAQYLWDDPKNDRLVYIDRHHTRNKKGNTEEEIRFVETIFLIVERGLIFVPNKGTNPETKKNT